MPDITITAAAVEDAEALLSIYAPYVTDTAVSFEYEVPSLADFRDRIKETLRRYPFFKAVRDGEIVGYAYLGAFKGRTAYDWSAECSVYLRMNERGRGIGRALYECLEETALQQGIRNLYACIAVPEKEDEYLTLDSPCFHARMGFAEVGRFPWCAAKFGRWYHMIWMGKAIAGHDAPPGPFIPFPELEKGEQP